MVLAIMSLAIIAAEATLLLKHDLSLFSRIINSLGDEEMSVQVNLKYWFCVRSFTSNLRLV